MQRRKRAANRHDVAKLAGVAPSTVSLVLNNTPGPRIPAATRQRVAAAAESLGYRSSAIAKALGSGKTHTIGVVMHFVERPFYQYSARIMDACWLALQPHGYRMLMVRGGDGTCVAGLYRERSVDGLIIMAAPNQAPDPELADLVEAGFPAVFIGSRPPAVACDYVDIDNLATAHEGTARLIRAGHREIVHLAGPIASSSAAAERLAGFRRAMAEAGLPVRDEQVVDGAFTADAAAEGLGRAMQAGLRCTAIFAANQLMAFGAVRVLAARGLRVPEDVVIAAIDRDPDGPQLPGLLCYDQPLGEIGGHAARILLERIGGDLGPMRSVLLPCRPVPTG